VTDDPAIPYFAGKVSDLTYPTLYCPTNAHNVKKNVELLKHI